jgi:hypothetical protein
MEIGLHVSRTAAVEASAARALEVRRRRRVVHASSTALHRHRHRWHMASSVRRSMRMPVLGAAHQSVPLLQSRQTDTTKKKETHQKKERVRIRSCAVHAHMPHSHSLRRQCVVYIERVCTGAACLCPYRARTMLLSKCVCVLMWRLWGRIAIGNRANATWLAGFLPPPHSKPKEP